MAQYIAVIRKTAATDYWVDVPDIPGCVASGETIQTAKAHFTDALSSHLAAMRADNESPRPPRAQLPGDDLEDSVETYFVDV